MERVLVFSCPRNTVRQIARRTRQALMTEGIDKVRIIGQFTDITPVLQLHALAHCDDDRCAFLLHPRNLINKMLYIERNLRQADHVDALAVLTARQCCRRGQPSRVATHDFHDGHVIRAIHCRVADDFLHHDADILRRRAVSRGVIRHHQVIINRLGHAMNRISLPTCLA